MPLVLADVDANRSRKGDTPRWSLAASVAVP